jgi:hypothetical protein
MGSVGSGATRGQRLPASREVSRCHHDAPASPVPPPRRNAHAPLRGSVGRRAAEILHCAVVRRILPGRAETPPPASSTHRRRRRATRRRESARASPRGPGRRWPPVVAVRDITPEPRPIAATRASRSAPPTRHSVWRTASGAVKSMIGSLCVTFAATRSIRRRRDT